MTSPYHAVAANYRENGYHVMPVGPGTKVPGEYRDGGWRPMPGWQKYCDALAPEFVHGKWEDWPDAGVCVAHGAVIGLDLDTDREDVATALRGAVELSPVRRKGAKGWMGYYRPGGDLDGLPARVRWYDPNVKGADGKSSRFPVIELLLHGTQSVLPPTIHPDTGQPYRWLTPDTLENTDISDLPVFGRAEFDVLDVALSGMGLTQQAPRTSLVGRVEYPATSHDLEKPLGRSINDRAMEPGAIDQWFPALGLPKTRQRGFGAWEAVATWRGSGSGRPQAERNPNLRIVPTGIRDFGTDEPFTPINLVCRWMSVDPENGFTQAADWLKQYIRPELGMSAEAMAALVARRPEVESAETERMPIEDISVDPGTVEMTAARSASRFMERKCGRARPKPIQPTSQREFRDAFPEHVPPFPVQDFESDLTGLLREATLFIDESANMRSEQGAFGAAVAALGVLMGRMVEIAETGLRTNIYVIGTAESGAGKSSAMGAMSKMMARCGVDDRLAGSDFTSGSAILKEVSSHVPQLFNVDEFGDVIRRVLAPRAASHERDIGRILKDLYSAASGTYRGKAYATQDRQDIVEPHLCVYGVSTHEAFWESIDGRSFNDGLRARFVMIPMGATETQTPDQGRAAMVADMITNLIDACKSGGNLGGFVCQAVKFDPGIWETWMQDRSLFQRHAERASRMKLPGAPSIIQRICENGMKVAMISALGRQPVGPTITAEDYNLGLDVAHWSAIYMIAAIDRYYVENASHRDLNRVMEFIEARGAAGCKRSDMVTSFQGIFVNAMVAKSIMEALKDSGKVIEWMPPVTGRGRPPTWYVGAKYAEEFFLRKGQAGDRS